MNRRNFLGGAGVAAVAGLAGCMDFITGDEALSFEADPVTASEAALDETEFTHYETEDISFNESVSYEDQEREVKLTNWMSEYRKTVTTPFGDVEAARFIAVSTPKIEAFGQSMNPVNEMDGSDLINYLTQYHEDLGEVEHVEERTTESLGSETTVTKYETTVEVEGDEVDAYLHMTKVNHRDDHILAVGVYPESLDEEENVFTLIETLEHIPVEGNDTDTDETDE